MKTFILFLALAVSAFAQAPAVRGNINASSVQGIPSGSSPVGTSGIAATQVAYGSAANTIKGSSQLLFLESASLQLSTAVTGGVQVFNTADQVTNVERFEMLWSSNVGTLRTSAAGTGLARNLVVRTPNSIFTLRSAGSTSGTYQFDNLSTSAAGNIAYNFSGYTNTATSGNNFGISLTPTYNQATGTANNTDLLINRTQTAVQAGTTQLFIDGQVGGVSQFSVSNTGGISVKQGTNARAGTFTLVAGTVTVANTSITANSVIEFTIKTVGGALGTQPAAVSATVVGTSFTVTAAATNTSTYNYIILEAAP